MPAPTATNQLHQIKSPTRKVEPKTIWEKHWRREHFMGHTIIGLGEEKLQTAAPDHCQAG